MPAKDKITWENRRNYIVERINHVLQEKGLKLQFSIQEIEKGIGKYYNHFVDAKKIVCERYLFVDYRSIDNMLKPWGGVEEQTVLFEPKTNQLDLFNN